MGVIARDISVSPSSPSPFKDEGVRGKMGSLTKSPNLSHVDESSNLSPTDVDVVHEVSNGNNGGHSDNGTQHMDTINGNICNLSSPLSGGPHYRGCFHAYVARYSTTTTCWCYTGLRQRLEKTSENGCTDTERAEVVPIVK